MFIRWKIPPVVYICLILWIGAPADSQTANSESSHGSQLPKTANTGSGIQTFSIQPTSSAEFTDLHTQNVSTFSSGQSMGAANTLELNPRTLTAIQDIPLTPSSTELGSVPSVLPSSSVTRSLSDALFSSSSEISLTAKQLPSLTTEATAEASLSVGSNISSTSESPPSSPYDSTSEFQSSESTEFPSSSQGTHAIQATSTVWGTATASDTLFQSTAAESTFYSEFPSLTISITPTQYSHFSSSFTSKTQSSFLSSSSSSVVIKPTTTISTTTTSTPGYVTLTPPSKPSGSGSSSGQDEGQGEKKPSQKEKSDLSSGTKTTIAIIATLCVLGVIIAGVLLYRRYNITHRSLKTFLTSGVRYKTYNNATYKDDEVAGDVGIMNELT